MTTHLIRIVRLAALPALLAVGTLTAPAVSAGNPCFHGFTMPPASSGTGNEIKLLPCAFAPTVTRVAVGSEVTFFNGPDFSHLITGANQEWGSPDVELPPGQSVSYTFDRAGIYPYACVLHPGMSGAIVVGDGAGAATGGATASTGGSGAAGGSVAPASDPDANPASLLLVALGIGAGLVAGAAAASPALRRRSNGDARRSADPLPDSSSQRI
jgi:plastocyanin